MTRKVLFISYIYPPLGMGGVYRSAKFVKYLPDFGWEPVVLTVKLGKRHRQKHNMDLSLQEEVSRARVHRTPSFEPRLWGSLPSRLGFSDKWLLRIPDRQVGWLPFAVKAGMRIIGKEKIDAIYSTSVPYTDHLIGYLLHRKTKLPWVADFRDPWTLHRAYTSPSSIHGKLEDRMERAVLEHASRVVTAWDGIRDGFLGKYPDITSEKITTITNGFDPEDFQGVVPKSFPRFTILFSGAIYQPVVPISPLIAGLKRLDPGVLDQLDVLLVGRVSPHEDAFIRKSGLKALKKLPYVPHREFVSYLLGAHVLLLLRERERRVLPGKIFEYLRAGKPVLAVIPPDSDAAQFLERTGTGTQVPPDKPEKIAEKITSLFNDWKQGTLGITPNREQVQEFSRITLTKRLAGLLDQLQQTPT